MMHLAVVSLMPDMFQALQYGVSGRALSQKLASLEIYNPRDYGLGPWKQVDDKPYGGGPGMVMMYDPLHLACEQAKLNMPAPVKTIYLSPQGEAIKQAKLNQLANEKQSLLLVAGRYEGVDQRFIDEDVDEEWSLGDFVLSGGELAAMVYIDALLRLLPGSLGHAASASQDSYMNGLLDHPHYTRPADINGHLVPKVLQSGNHQAIDSWRRQQSLGQTWLKRPDLLAKMALSDEDRQLLAKFKDEHKHSK